MNFDAAIAKYNNQVLNDYGGECVSLAAHYCLDNGKPIAYANAKDWWGHPALTGAFDFVTNNPTDYSQIPPRGSIIIWNGGLAGSGGYGHIAIFDAVIAAGSFRSFDNNWGGRYVHFVTHNWNNVIGWMVPKVSTPQGEEMIANLDQARLAYRLLRGDTPVTDGELNGTAGKRTWVEFATTAGPEIASREQNKRDIQAQLQNIQNKVNEQNQAITSLSTQVNATEAEKAALLSQIADANAEIATAHDTITDLEKTQGGFTPTDRENQNKVLAMVTSIFNYFAGQFKTFQKYRGKL